MKAYITKYALTERIYIVDGEISDRTPTMFIVGESRCGNYFHRPDWHLDWDSAKERAESMRQKAIQSARAKVERLQNLRFDEP